MERSASSTISEVDVRNGIAVLSSHRRLDFSSHMAGVGRLDQT